MTATRSHICLMTGRSCDIKRIVKPKSSCRSFSKFKICACTDTSRADVGSSQIRIFGLDAPPRKAAKDNTVWRSTDKMYYDAKGVYDDIVSKFLEPTQVYRFESTKDKTRRPLTEDDFKDGIYQTVIWYLNNLSWCDKIKQKSNYSGERIGIKNL